MTSTEDATSTRNPEAGSVDTAILFERTGERFERTPRDIKVEPVQSGAIVTTRGACERCGGAGRSDAWRHTGSTCYDCQGDGIGRPRSRRVYTAKRLATLLVADTKRQAKRVAASAAAVAERDAKAATLIVEHAAWLARLDAIIAEPRRTEYAKRLAADLAEKVRGQALPPTSGQVALVTKIEAEPLQVAAPEGRVEFTGTVVSLKLRDSGFGSTWKIVLRSAGWSAWGTAPNALLDEIPSDEVVGSTITLRATVTRSDDDASFGFFKRPTLLSVEKGKD